MKMTRYRTMILAMAVAGSCWGAPREKKAAEYEAEARQAMADYDFEKAASTLDDWEESLTKKRKEVPALIDELRSRVTIGRNMMQRVERIEIIDSVNVDAADFYNYYVLSSDAGSLLDPSYLPQGVNRVGFTPGNGKQVFYSEDHGGRHRLMRFDVLDDGTMLPPQPVGDDMGDGGDADYPFLCADGVTFYFAADGESSLGGYDIYFTRFDSDGQPLQPQNVGMPYNSPDNDYMLVIDETNNLGWWATDRNHIPGKVTIYTYRPNASRVNVPVDDPRLADYARLTDIEINPEGRELIAELDNEAYDPDEVEEEEFAFSLGDGRVYTRYSDFSSDQARQAMRQLMQRRRDSAEIAYRLASLRARYAAGDKSTASQIRDLERQQLADPAIQERLVNTIVSLETKR